MERYTGKIGFSKTAIATIRVLSSHKCILSKEVVQDIKQQKQRFECAKKQGIEQIKDILAQNSTELGKESAAILEGGTMILEDVLFTEYVNELIDTQHVDAAYAVYAAKEYFVKEFMALPDDYMRARALDVEDVANRLINIMLDVKHDVASFEVPTIIVADELDASVLLQMNRSNLCGVVLHKTSDKSHVAILLKSMKIPLLFDIPSNANWNGKEAAIDGKTGDFFVAPDGEVKKRILNQIQAEHKHIQMLQKYKGKKTITKSGREMDLFANIGQVEDVEDALENDAQGIGLFRSEFLYLGRDNYPSEEEQYNAYKTVLEKMEKRPVIIRTMDIGSDKKADYMELEPEENPAMGYRAIRFGLTNANLFKEQLKALFRAGTSGNLSIMFPMITSVDEIERINVLIQEVEKELTKEKKEFRRPRIGIMIETPAAVMISDMLAKMVDFFSIGTNDLGQYTMAIDRQNHKLDGFYDAHHPALIRMIEMTIQNAHRNHIPVGICGELACDEQLTELFVKMGVDELSVLPAFVLPLREKICEME